MSGDLARGFRISNTIFRRPTNSSVPGYTNLPSQLEHSKSVDPADRYCDSSLSHCANFRVTRRNVPACGEASPLDHPGRRQGPFTSPWLSIPTAYDTDTAAPILAPARNHPSPKAKHSPEPVHPRDVYSLCIATQTPSGHGRQHLLSSSTLLNASWSLVLSHYGSYWFFQTGASLTES